jgi:hypothetical protein
LEVEALAGKWLELLLVFWPFSEALPVSPCVQVTSFWQLAQGPSDPLGPFFYIAWELPSFGD